MGRLQAFATSRSPQLYALTGVLVIGLLIRLAVAPFGEYAYDADSMRRWATLLADRPPWDFFNDPYHADHLPGDLWILWALAHVYKLFSPEMNVDSDFFLWLTKLVPAIADAGSAVMLYLIGRRVASSTVGVIAATVFLLNPGSIFLTSMWGQWDPVSVCFALVALWLFLSGRVMLALPALTYACLIKPQFAALAPLLALAWCLQWWKPYPSTHNGGSSIRKSHLISAGTGVLLSIVVLALVLLPFNVGQGPIARHDLLDRLRFAVDRWEFMSMYAFNLWGAVDPPVDYALKPDEPTWILGMSYRVWGVILTSVAYVLILGMYARRPEPRQLLWAAMAIMLVLFILPTRVHERYLLPAVTLMTLFAVLTPTFRVLYVGFTATFLINLWFAYNLFDRPPLVDKAARSEFFYVYLSLLNVAMAIVVLLTGAVFRGSALGVDREASSRGNEHTALA